MLLAALVVAGVSTVVFIVASGVATLLIARLLSGVGAGLTQVDRDVAALAELEPRHNIRRAALTGAAVNTGAIGLGP